MQLDQAVALLTRDHLQVEHSRRPIKVVIPVLSPGKVGGRAFVEVADLAAGFDWDTGKVFVEPQEPLTRLSPEDVEAIRKSVSLGQSWHAFEDYKRRKAEKDRIRELLTKVREHLDTRADFCSTYPPGTHPLNDEAKLLLEVIAVLEKPA